MSAAPVTTPGRGSLSAETGPARAWRWVREHAVNVVAILVVIYLLVPIAVIFGFSFNNPAGRYNFTWVGFTLSHWSHPFSNTELTEALLTSLRLAVLATVISTIIGTMMAIALVRHNFLGRRVANFLIVIPMATPEVVMGAALLSFFLLVGTTLGFETLLIAHIMFCISFVVVGGEVAVDRLRPQPRGGGQRPRRERLHDLPPGHLPADPARHLRRRDARLRALDR